MPLYDYSCKSCGSFEAQRLHTEAGTPAVCPECGAFADRQWSVPVVASNGNPTSFNGRKARMTPPPLQSGSTAFRAPARESRSSESRSSAVESAD